jgi:hypothetical protein
MLSNQLLVASSYVCWRSCLIIATPAGGENCRQPIRVVSETEHIISLTVATSHTWTRHGMSMILNNLSEPSSLSEHAILWICLLYQALHDTSIIQASNLDLKCWCLLSVPCMVAEEEQSCEQEQNCCRSRRKGAHEWYSVCIDLWSRGLEVSWPCRQSIIWYLG